MNHKQRKKRNEAYKRRRHNNRDVKYQNKTYEMIDGNFTHYPYGYCKYHKGWLTKNMTIIHKCEDKNCVQFDKEVD